MSTGLALEVISVERLDGTDIIVEFSDSTWARFSTDELIAMRPEREWIDSTGTGGNGSS
jgi:hypothetical protein